MAQAFSGFPPDALLFLSEITENNNKAWFDANRARFDQGLAEPGRAFVEALGPRLQALSPDLQYEARVNGSLFVFHRDTRFSADKRPYKDEQGFRFWSGPDRKAARSALFLRIRSDLVGLGAGCWEFGPEQTIQYREAVAGPRGAALAHVLQGLEMGGCRYIADSLKRVPAPYPQDHPQAELLKRRGLVVGLDSAPPPQLHSAEFVDWCVAGFQRLLPVHRWLLDTVT